MKQSLDEGSFTAADVGEFEKLIGVSVDELLSTLNMAGGANLKSNPELKELYDVFKKISDIKKKKN